MYILSICQQLSIFSGLYFLIAVSCLLQNVRASSQDQLLESLLWKAESRVRDNKKKPGKLHYMFLSYPVTVSCLVQNERASRSAFRKLLVESRMPSA